MPAPTHFLCLPLAAPQLARSWAAFRADATSPTGGFLPPDAVRPLGTLHLTLGVMTLGPEGIDAAVRLLRQLPLPVAASMSPASTSTSPLPPPPRPRPRLPSPLDPSPAADGGLCITLAGLHAMHAPPRTSVLYAAPHDPRGLLRRACEQLRQPFLDAGLMCDDGRPLLLHATVVNTVYVRGRRRGARMTLDARHLVDRYADFVWAEALPVNKLAICRMGAKKLEGGEPGDAAYEVEAETGLSWLGHA